MATTLRNSWCPLKFSNTWCGSGAPVIQSIICCVCRTTDEMQKAMACFISESAVVHFSSRNPSRIQAGDNCFVLSCCHPKSIINQQWAFPSYFIVRFIRHLRDKVMLWIVVTAFWVPDTFHFFYRSFLRDPDPLTGLVESDKKWFGISASLWLWPHSSRSFSPVSPSCHGLCAYHHDGLWLLLGSGWGVAEKVPWWVVKSPEILWATSSESKPVLLGIHRKNA